LGFATPRTYEEWSRRLGARVLSILRFDYQTDGRRWVNCVLDRGRGRLLDRIGLDWWEIIAAAHYEDVHMLYLLDRVRNEIPSGGVELAGTRPQLFVRMLGQALECSVRYFPNANLGIGGRAMRVMRAARRLRLAQMVEIAFDKWDPCYSVRRHAAKHKRAKLREAAVLIPSAYSNVTRSALAYAAQLPHRRFLLATTRRSALLDGLPANVTTVPLAAYVTTPGSADAETAELTQAWHRLLLALQKEATEFREGASVGAWDHFAIHLARGLRLRDAWKHLIECEPIEGVLCGDDLNYYTRLPLMVAYRTGLNAIYCSHGALDGGFLFKMPEADYFLVKGQMERDYLQRSRPFEPARIIVGAPDRDNPTRERDLSAEALVFFSQPYEGDGGRTEMIYRELLPRLCSAATRSRKKVIVKLHPFESKREREALATSILAEDARQNVEFVGGQPPEAVMARAWCGITVDSSVAVECALMKIPFFMCGWLDFSGMGYLQQFAKFGVGRVLNIPEEIEQIPEMVAEYRPDPAALELLWQKANPAVLDEIMFRTRQVRLHTCAC